MYGATICRYKRLTRKPLRVFACTNQDYSSSAIASATQSYGEDPQLCGAYVVIQVSDKIPPHCFSSPFTRHKHAGQLHPQPEVLTHSNLLVTERKRKTIMKSVKPHYREGVKTRRPTHAEREIGTPRSKKGSPRLTSPSAESSAHSHRGDCNQSHGDA